MATAWCRNALRKQEARGGRTLGRRSIGGFLKEAPKPPRTFLEFVFDRTNALRQSHAGSLFQSQFSAARVQPPDPLQGRVSRQRQGGKPLPGAGDAPSQRRPASAAGHLHDRGNRQHRGKPSPGACFSGSACAASDSVPGYLHGRVCKCRKRFNAGVPGAVAPGKIILESPPSPEGKGGRIKTKGRAGRRPKTQAAHANITAAVSTSNAGGKPPPGACFSGSACAASDSVPGYLHGRVCKCRKRFNAGVPGAVAPGKIILESPPSPPGKSALRARVGGIGATKKANGRGGRRPKRQAAHANITAAGQANTAKNKRQYRKQHAIHC